MTPDILKSPCRVNERSRVVYFFDGYVAADIISGTEEQQRAALALVGQAQRMAWLLSKTFDQHNCHVPPDECSICGPIRTRECPLFACGAENRIEMGAPR